MRVMSTEACEVSPVGESGCAYEDCYSDKASEKDNILKQCIMVFTLSCSCLLRGYRCCPQV